MSQKGADHPREQDRLSNDRSNDDDEETREPGEIPDAKETPPELERIAYEIFREQARVVRSLMDIEYQLVRIGDALGETHSQPAESPSEPVNNGTKRGEMREILQERGIDTDGVKIANFPDDEKVRLEADGVDNDEGDPWREFTSEHFGDDEIGTINWEQWEDDDGNSGWYPASFELPYDAFDEVRP